MSRIDDVFGRLATKLINKWQSNNLRLVRVGKGSYNKLSGSVEPSEQIVSVKGVVLTAKVEQDDGLTQEGDVMIILDPVTVAQQEELTTADRFRYTLDGREQEARVVKIERVQGDNTLGYFIVARPQ